MTVVSMTAENAMAFEEKRTRSISIAEGGAIDCSERSRVDELEYCCSGIHGKYSGGVNEDGKPHGNGTFVRDNCGKALTYIGTFVRDNCENPHN